jgi:hypothetical protein
MAGPLISVLVPVQEAGDSLVKLVDSLDDQSLSIMDFEIVFADQRTSEHAAARLDRLQARRPNTTIVSLPAAGTTAEALNAALDAARGTYVLPMGPADVTFPRSLELITRFAEEHDCDVVVGRGLGPARPGIDQSLTLRDVPRLDPAARLLALTHPFAVYRRELLDRHALRYGGAESLLDRTFHAAVLNRTDAVGVLAGYPLGRGHGLAEAYPVRPRPAARAHWWQDVRGAVAESDDPAARALFLTAETAAAVRVLALADDQELTVAVLAEVDQHCRPEYDALATPQLRLLADPLRRGDWAELQRLVTALSGFQAEADSVKAHWDAGVLAVEVTGRLQAPDAEVDLTRADLQRVIAEASIMIGVRNRLTAPIHRAETVGHWSIESSSAGQSIRFTAQARLDPGQLDAGSPLTEGPWQVACSFAGISLDTAPVLPLPMTPAGTVILRDRPVAVVPDRTGTLHLDVGATTSNGMTDLAPEHATLVETADGTRLTIALPSVTATEPSVQDCVVRIGTLRLPARLEAGPDRSFIECFATGLAGDYPIATAFGAGSLTPSGLTLRVGHVGDMIIVPSN